MLMNILKRLAYLYEPEDKVHSVNHRRKNILRIRIKIGFATLDKRTSRMD